MERGKPFLRVHVWTQHQDAIVFIQTPGVGQQPPLEKPASNFCCRWNIFLMNLSVDFILLSDQFLFWRSQQTNCIMLEVACSF